MNNVRVMRNPVRSSPHTWIVLCGLCSNHGLSVFGPFAAFVAGQGWWSPTWQDAQDFAAAHARDHEATRCPTCLHLPERQLSPEETTAR